MTFVKLPEFSLASVPSVEVYFTLVSDAIKYKVVGGWLHGGRRVVAW